MRVTAMQSFKNGVMTTYGEGEYIGDLVPDSYPFNQLGIKNPCIKLDGGGYVWGFQCWWGETEKFNSKYKDHITETILVSVGEDAVLPLNNLENEKK